MEQFKIEHFESDGPWRSFPEFVTLSKDEADRIRLTFERKTGIDTTKDKWDLLRYLESLSCQVKNVNAESEDFDLSLIAYKVGLKPRDEIYINWDDFTTIDRMNFLDLSKYFDDIWYPGPDDIEIFDDTFSWILFISHWGGVNFLDLTKFS
ncbi:MAG: hypothetical protein M1536_03850 [Firmicutes bacterium]|nr:hypothetical protein [Bacillota bacterium]